MRTPIRVAALDLKIHIPAYNVRYDFLELDEKHPYLLSKGNPISFERDFYVDNDENSIGFIMLNEISLELHADETQNELKFSIRPYLAPESCAPGEVACRKRLPPPIMYKVTALPQRIDVETSSGGPRNQALLGNDYTLNFRVKPHADILLKSVSARVLEVCTGKEPPAAELHHSLT